MQFFEDFFDISISYYILFYFISEDIINGY